MTGLVKTIQTCDALIRLSRISEMRNFANFKFRISPCDVARFSLGKITRPSEKDGESADRKDRRRPYNKYNRYADPTAKTCKTRHDRPGQDKKIPTCSVSLYSEFREFGNSEIEIPKTFQFPIVSWNGDRF